MRHRSFIGRCGLIGCFVGGHALAQAPANDLCSDATLVSLSTGCAECTPVGGGMFAVEGFIADSTVDGGATGCGGVGNIFGGVWYRFVGEGHRVTLQTTPTTGEFPDTQLSVYCGACAGLSCVAFNDDAPLGIGESSVQFCARAGVTYWVLVNSRSNTFGQFGLRFGRALDANSMPVACCDPQACGGGCTFQIPPGADQESGGLIPGPIGPAPEPEPCVSNAGYTNNSQYNDLCSLTPPSNEVRRHTTIDIGQTIWGNAWADNQQRDRDWILNDDAALGANLVRYEVSAEGPILPRLYFNAALANFSTCSPMLGLVPDRLDRCGRTMERITIVDGTAPAPSGNSPGHTFGFLVSLTQNSGYPCGTNTRYWLTLKDVVDVADCPTFFSPPGSVGEADLPTFNGLGGNDGFTVGEPCTNIDPDGPGPDERWRKAGCEAIPVSDGEFLRLTPGTPIVGRLTGVFGSAGIARDTDYYKFEIAQRSIISLHVDAPAPVMAIITENSCADDAKVYAIAATRGRCLPASHVEAPDLVVLDPGTYIVVAAMTDAFVSVGSGAIFAPVGCADSISHYALSLDADPLPACAAVCAPNSITEFEPCVVSADEMFNACLADNDGCGRAPYTSNAFIPGIPACGTLFSVFEPPTGAVPETGAQFFVDEDYWSFTVPTRSLVTFAAASDGPVRVQLVKTGVSGALCDAGAAPILEEIDASACLFGDEGSVEVGPGTYAFAVAPGSVEVGLSFGDYSCGQTIAYTLAASLTPACCLGNADHVQPGQVSFSDITTVLTFYGASDDSGLTGGDANCDGLVDFADITQVLASFNASCP